MDSQSSSAQKKNLDNWIIFSLLVYYVFALGFLGYGIYAVYEANNLRNSMNDEIEFFVNNSVTDNLCIQVDESRHISIQCPVVSTDNEFKEITVKYESDPSVSIANNDESLYMNFQDGINLPGLDISTTPNFLPDVNYNIQDLAMNYYNVDLDDVTITSTGSFIFGETATINSEYSLPDYAGIGWSNPDLYRSFNMLFIGNFNTQTFTLTQRCSADLRVSGSSIYVLVAADQSARFCSCVKSFSSYTEYCSPILEKYGGISYAVV